jgi:DNA recombination protein RmuC
MSNDLYFPPTVVASAVCGGAAFGAALAFALATRGRVAAPTSSSLEGTLSALLQDFSHNMRQDLSKEVQASMLATTKHVGSSLQSQEREFSKRLAEEYNKIQKGLAPVGLANQALQTMNQRMENVERVFLSPQKRGVFGELALESIISDIFPPNSVSFQTSLSNGKRPDCILHLPSPIGNLCIDSKFPLDSIVAFNKVSEAIVVENPLSQRTVTSSSSPPEVKEARKKVEEALRKHIKDISSKYIIPGETADCAILFLPSSSLFAQVVEDFPSVYAEANRQAVWIACPTTLLAVLTTLRGVVRGIKMSEQSQIMLDHVGEITKDVDRLVIRMDRAQKSVDAAKESLRMCQISMEKIQRRRFKLDLMEDDKSHLDSTSHRNQAQRNHLETPDPSLGLKQQELSMNGLGSEKSRFIEEIV